MEPKRKPFPWIRWIIVILILFFLVRFELPYYYSQPGMAQPVEEMVEVEDGYRDDTGTFMLTTVRSAHATPILMFWSLFSDFRSISPAPTGITNEEYDLRQRALMVNSQESAKIAAYEAAGVGNVVLEYEGVYVSAIIDGMSADGLIEPGDIITHVNGEWVETSEALLDRLSGYSDGDTVDLTVLHNEEILTKTLTFSHFPEEVDSDRVGIGIAGPETLRNAEFTPRVDISAGAIGGPSAGLMFSLEVYSQLLEVDLTKGYQIAGTGRIDEEGNVGPIGGANQKVVAADEQEADFFLVPNEQGAAQSNFVEAQEAAEAIASDMQIVPVDTLEEALSFLESLPPYEGTP